jgi:hypothetical protein
MGRVGGRVRVRGLGGVDDCTGWSPTGVLQVEQLILIIWESPFSGFGIPSLLLPACSQGETIGPSGRQQPKGKKKSHNPPPRHKPTDHLGVVRVIIPALAKSQQDRKSAGIQLRRLVQGDFPAPFPSPHPSSPNRCLFAVSLLATTHAHHPSRHNLSSDALHSHPPFLIIQDSFINLTSAPKHATPGAPDRAEHLLNSTLVGPIPLAFLVGAGSFPRTTKVC